MKKRIITRPSDFVEETAARTFRKVRHYQWKYRNLIFLFISLVAAFYIIKSGPIVSFIEGLGYFGYPAAFVAGLFFTYGLTTAPATAALYNLGLSLNPFLIAFIAAFGCVISDYAIFTFVRNRLAKEIQMLSREINQLTKPISKLFLEEELRVRIWQYVTRSRLWNLFVPVLAGFIIASPLPDEVGIAIFGATKFSAKNFLIVAYTLNFFGILAIAYSTRIFG